MDNYPKLIEEFIQLLPTLTTKEKISILKLIIKYEKLKLLDF